MSLLSYFVWDPNPALFNFDIPLLNRPILWYGFFFAFGFFMGYLILIHLLKDYFHAKDNKTKASKFAEQLTFYVLIGAIVGARLGDVLFYQSFRDIIHDPFSIFAIWKGGLASHGGALGILVALILFSKKHKTPFWLALDFTVIPTALAAVFIRIGNFFNQEILGTPTNLPWGVLFVHPADGGAIVPRHPAQLYEAIAYLLIFFILFLYWKRTHFKHIGKTTGLFLILVFGFRFCIEWIKMEQSIYLSQSSVLTMGQILSIPFIFLGLYLFFRNGSKRHGPQ